MLFGRTGVINIEVPVGESVTPRWFRVDDSMAPITTSKGIVLTNGGKTLIFTNVQRSTAGRYLCQLGSRKVIFDVAVSQPQATNINYSYGSSVDVFVSEAENRILSVRWYRVHNNQKIYLYKSNKYNFYQNNKVLRIHDMTAADDGTYVAEVMYDGNIETYRFTLSLLQKGYYYV